MNVTVDTFAAVSGLIAAIGTFAVCKWRINDLDRRVLQLEQLERNHSDRVITVETKLSAIESLLQRIAEKLDVR
jgi:hypothetical protein